MFLVKTKFRLIKFNFLFIFYLHGTLTYIYLVLSFVLICEILICSCHSSTFITAIP